MSSIEVMILEKSGLFAFENSISTDISTAHVVPLSLLQDYLMGMFPSHFQELLHMYNSLEGFLKTAARDIVREGLVGSWQLWNYEVMTTKNYYLDKRHEHDCFSNLTWNHLEEHSLLFIFYIKEDKRRYEAERASMNKKIRRRQEASENGFHNNQDPIATNELHYQNTITSEVLGLCHSLTPTQKAMDSIRHLRKKIQNMLNQVWPGMNYQVVIFGSSANSLALTNADVDFCIVVPEAKYEQDLYQHRNKLSKIPKSVYNMFFLASRLRGIGMRDVEAIGHASVPICKFVDPQTGLNCDINANNILGIENTRMIQRYCDLDSRIRPLIFAIKQFVKQKDINNPRGGTLSSYAYVIMVLHFLMSALEHPVIPSLQRLQASCTSRDCNFKSFKPIPVLHDHHIINCDARYHDCVQIQGVGEYSLQIKGSTSVWHGRNTDSIAKLLQLFFQYYSIPQSFCMSIVSSDGGLIRSDELYPDKSPFTIQDPFINSKNIARSCTVIGASIILQEFQRATELLSEGGHSFVKICDPSLNLNRPIDTESMEFRFQRKNDRKVTTRQDKFVGYLDREKKTQTLLEAKQVIDVWTGSESELEAAHADEWYISQPVVWENNSPIKIERPVKRENQQSSSSSNEGRSQNQATASSSSAEPRSSESTGTAKDISPILQLVKTIMALQPKSENELETFSTRPCTDMDKLLNDSVVSTIQPKDLCYLIAQLNFLGDAVAGNVLTNAAIGQQPQQQQRRSETDNPTQAAYLKQLQHALETIGISEDDDDSYNMNGTDSDLENDDEEEVNINYIVDNVPDCLDSYEIYDLFQWYGSVVNIEYMENPRPSWCVRLIMKYKNVKLLPVNPEFEGFFVRLYLIELCNLFEWVLKTIVSSACRSRGGCNDYNGVTFPAPYASTEVSASTFAAAGRSM
ncbi:hypothetical protein MFLAVUS_009628 [Mucor flavus]|uniref:Poly(A) RNA polymerase mitochondrial-like central palm domain-containing protein n=1 Tax=Mucor flavus TaxID=439312 RepID=A0ABP9ZAK1_9FUNG